MFTVTDSVENTGATAITLFPYAIVAREGEPVHQAAWTLHEGMFGVLQGLLEKHTYADLRGAKLPESKFEGTGGWLGLTDKYWMATLIPPQKEKFNARFSIAREKTTEIFRADYLLAGRNIAAGGKASVTHSLFAGAKIVSLVEDYQKQMDIYRYDMTIDHHLLDVPGPRLAQQARWQFRRRHYPADDFGENPLLPLGQSFLRIDDQDEEGPARDEGPSGALQGRPRQTATGTDGALQA
jgi:hypothetical protein